jgi:hypothetical protein
MATQAETVHNARYYLGPALLIADDFLKNAVPVDAMKQIDLRAAYVIRLIKPTSCMLFIVGTGGCWMPDIAALRYRYVNFSDAENSAMGHLMNQLDPANTYKLQIKWFHIDLKEALAVFLRQPTDEDLADLHLEYRKSLASCTVAKIKCVKNDVARRARAIRDLDRRRFEEGGIIPPPERKALFDKYMAVKATNTARDKLLLGGIHALDEEDDDMNDPYIQSFTLTAQAANAQKPKVSVVAKDNKASAPIPTYGPLMLEAMATTRDKRKLSLDDDENLFGSASESEKPTTSATEPPAPKRRCIMQKPSMKTGDDNCQMDSELGPSFDILDEDCDEEEIDSARMMGRGAAIGTVSATAAVQRLQKPHRQYRTKSARGSTQKNLAATLKSLQAQSRREHRRRLRGTSSSLDQPFIGGGGFDGGDD